MGEQRRGKKPLKDLSVVRRKFPGCWIILFALGQNAQYSLEGRNKINTVKASFHFEVRGRGQKGQRAGVEVERGRRLDANCHQAALSRVLSSKLLEVGNSTFTAFIGPSVSTVSGPCLHESTQLFTYFLNIYHLVFQQQIFIACLPSARCRLRAPSVHTEGSP